MVMNNNTQALHSYSSAIFLIWINVENFLLHAFKIVKNYKDL